VKLEPVNVTARVSTPALLGLGLLAALGVGFLVHQPPAPGPVTWNVPSPLEARTARDARTYWAREGFVEMTPPVRPPTSTDGELRIVVYVRLPEGATVTLGKGEGATALVYPPGTAADRVEYFARGDRDGPPGDGHVADVRGTEILKDGQRFHVLRPARASSGKDLLGLAWMRGDEASEAMATRAVGDLVERGFALGPAGGRARAEAAEHLRGLNGCAGCHALSRPPRRDLGPVGAIHRGTDGSGFFQVSTVLTDRQPIETYRPRNANAGDRFIRFVCGVDESDARIADDGLGGVRCDGGEVPVGVLDVHAALQAGDLHAERLCASRRYLVAHLDAAARRAFQREAAECDAP
jgi:hypothetical protein